VDLQDEIDRAARALVTVHGSRLRCGRGCSACCLDDLSVCAIEAERIRRAHPDLLRNGEPHEVGACAFLDHDGACRVYEERPAVCRSQGLPLRILFENECDEIEERRDICPLNLEGGPAIDLLDEEDCWLVGPHELRLGQLDDRFTEGRSGGARQALRSLFEKSRPV
jgi:Fe-S-cluster containining protein